MTPQQYEEYINGDLSSLHSPWLLKDMDRAAQLVKSAIDNNETIRIVGDMILTESIPCIFYTAA